ncbi:CapA family protein [Salinimicrobium flavum]|uniref:CapA family protein n=1 Tax=Salinimicrobium flavum TaxID=1737065 RepID=A0ABW5IUA0_9FLAO
MPKWRIIILLAIFIGFWFNAGAQGKDKPMEEQRIKLFLGGDVMTGRGIDQALPVSVDPVIYESYVKDARGYLQLAEKENGRIEVPVSYSYIWGDALKIWKLEEPHLKLINLETSVTTHNEPWPGKGIQYRMHPKNVQVLTAARIDHVSLANNHVMDWSREGLKETLKTLKKAGIQYSGAGKDTQAAIKPAVITTEAGRILVFSYGARTSGIPRSWEAGKDISGVNLLTGLGKKEVREITHSIDAVKKEGDLVIFSIHWGGNWGYEIPERHKVFAHKLIDEAGVDLVFGHSSHHPIGIEVYKEKLIIYGAGDFMNDYEGISGHEEYRPYLSLMYFPEIDMATGRVVKLKMVPMQIKKFRLRQANERDVLWLQRVLNREGGKLGTAVISEKQALRLKWE